MELEKETEKLPQLSRDQAKGAYMIPKDGILYVFYDGALFEKRPYEK